MATKKTPPTTPVWNAKFVEDFAHVRNYLVVARSWLENMQHVPAGEEKMIKDTLASVVKAVDATYPFHLYQEAQILERAKHAKPAPPKKGRLDPEELVVDD